jgi:hypothetical protein
MSTRFRDVVRTIALVLLIAGLPSGFVACGGGDGVEGGGLAGQPGGLPPGGDLLPRILPVKPPSTVVTEVQNREMILVKFMDDTGIRLQGSWPTIPASVLDPALADALTYVEGGTWARTHHVEDPVLDETRETAQENAGQVMADFTVMFTLTLPLGVDRGLACDAFNASSAVELAWPMSLPPPLPVPPDYESLQGYLNDATGGIGALTAHAAGVRGAGVQVADIEYSWNYAHQDLPTVTHLGPAAVDPFSSDHHGTAVLGVMASLDNGWGTTGACPDASFYTVAANTSGGYSVSAAIMTALATLGPGDILLIEQQIWGTPVTGNYVPSEWTPAVRAATITAVANGVTVVAAAGNGNVDLDQPGFGGYWSAANDSGAIIVGAGASPGSAEGDRSRLGFSTYGSTVDLQGWGHNVMTTGYGTYYSAEGYNLYYTSAFNGTSSASPVVASACALVQSFKLAGPGIPLLPTQVRNLLQSTGSPQLAGTNPLSQNIGPRPDVVAALGCLDITGPSNQTVSCNTNNGSTQTHTFTVSGSGGQLVLVEYLVDGTLVDSTTRAGDGSVSFTHTFSSLAGGGPYTVDALATAASGCPARWSFQVTVIDNPPSITCPGTITAECTSPSGAAVTYAATATDDCSTTPTIAYAPPSGSTFPIGTTLVTATATDDSGQTDRCTFNVTVQDTTPPFVSATARRLMLFMPRNGLIDIVLQYSAFDTCDASPTNTVTVYSDQPDTGPPYTPDAVWNAANQLEIRAEVDLTSPAPGRVFLIVVESTDASTNTGRRCTWVIVPKTATAQDVVGARNIAVTAQSNCDAGATMPPPGWFTVLPTTTIP